MPRILPILKYSVAAVIVWAVAGARVPKQEPCQKVAKRAFHEICLKEGDPRIERFLQQGWIITVGKENEND